MSRTTLYDRCQHYGDSVQMTERFLSPSFHVQRAIHCEKNVYQFPFIVREWRFVVMSLDDI